MHQLISFWFSFHMVINIHKNSQLQEGKVFVVTKIFHCLVQASYFMLASFTHTHTHTLLRQAMVMKTCESVLHKQTIKTIRLYA